jgi:hypothetical protein
VQRYFDWLGALETLTRHSIDSVIWLDTIDVNQAIALKEFPLDMVECLRPAQLLHDGLNRLDCGLCRASRDIQGCQLDSWIFGANSTAQAVNHSPIGARDENLRPTGDPKDAPVQSKQTLQFLPID